LEDVITQVSYEQEEEEYETMEYSSSPLHNLMRRLFFCCGSRTGAVAVPPQMKKSKKRRKKEPSFTNIFKNTASTPTEDDDEMILMGQSDDDDLQVGSHDHDVGGRKSSTTHTTKTKRVRETTVVIRTKHSEIYEEDEVRIEPFCLLGPQPKDLRQKKTLVLDLDETLVHSSFKKVSSADIVVHVEIEDLVNPVYVLKRPGVDEFLRQVGELFEVVVFTASLSKYANPLLDQLDKEGVIHSRLFREHCTYVGGAYKKDLSRLGRDVSQVIIVDNSPICYDLQPQNAIPVTSWFEDRYDQELPSLLPWLHKLAGEKDVYTVLSEMQEWRKRM